MIIDVIRLNEALENRIFMVFHLNPTTPILLIIN